jgi:hypothetical protein
LSETANIKGECTFRNASIDGGESQLRVINCLADHIACAAAVPLRTAAAVVRQRRPRRRHLGNYIAASFVTAADGHGGTVISEAAQTANLQPLLTHPHAT